MTPQTKRELLEQYLRTNVRKSDTEQFIIPPRPSGVPTPLSYGQQQIWLHTLMAGDAPIYNEPVAVHHSGPLDIGALERTLSEILRRHEAWRTTFELLGDEPVQVVQPASAVTLPVFDVRGLPEHDRAAEAWRLAREEACRKFDLTQGPLIRFTLLRLGEEKHRLLITLHHLVFDGVSIYQIFLPELAAIYDAYSGGKPSPLPELSIQYGDYAYWQRQRTTTDNLSNQFTYWRRQLSGELPALALPMDRPRPAVQSFHGAIEPFALPGDLSDALKILSQREKATLYMTLLAAFAGLLFRYSGQTDIVIGGVTAGRKVPATKGLIGYFLNPLAFRIDCSGNPSFRELLSRVREVVLEALSHEDVPFELVVKELQPKRDSSHGPIVQALFSLEPPLAAGDAKWQVSQLDVETGTAKYDLSIMLDQRPDRIIGRLNYSTDLFDAGTIRRMLTYWRTVLEGVVKDPARRLSETPLMSGSDRCQIMADWNQTQADYPRDRCVQQLFEAQVEHTPEAIAVVFEGKSITYRELNARANQLARSLKKRGVSEESLVGIYAERSVEAVIGVLGTLKAGAAYVALDPERAADTNQFIVGDAGIRILLTQGELRKAPRESSENLEGSAGPDKLACVVYPLEPVGKPPAVTITHRSVSNLLYWMREAFTISASDRLLHNAALTDPVSVWELLLPLTAGARLVITKPGGYQNREYMARIMAEEQVSLAHFTPAALRELLEQPATEWCHNLKWLLCSGEPLSSDLRDRVFARTTARLYYLHGQIEAGIHAMCFEILRNTGPVVPIGRPIANMQAYILDPALQPVPVGIPGELYLGGDGLARGYWHRPDLMAERFPANPFVEGARLFKTGDLVRYRSDSQIEFLGRIDDHVKTPAASGSPTGAPPPEFVAHRNSIEVKLTEIWEDILARRPISVRSNFFDIGGHSFLVTKMLCRIEQQFGRKLSMATLFQAPTIEQLAAILREPETPLAAPVVMGIKSSGGKRPFFCMGGGPLFRPLAQLLGEDQPFLGLVLPPAEVEHLSLPYKLEEIAGHFTRMIREKQPQGPYYLGGWCLAGLLAYETARQLAAQRERVALLALFDTQNPNYGEGADRFRVISHKLKYYLAAIGRFDPREAPAYARSFQQSVRYRTQIVKWRMSREFRMRLQNGKLDDPEHVTYLATRAYRPEPYPGRVAIFKPAERPNGEYWDLEAGWMKIFTGELAIHEIPGDHRSIFEEPNVRVLAKSLGGYLSEDTN